MKLILELANRFLQRHSNLIFHKICNTPPVIADRDAPVVLYSVLERGSVHAYLLAAKSFLQYCAPMHVVVQGDGSLDERAKAKLRSHIVGIEILDRGATESHLATRLPAALRRMLPDLNRVCFFLPLKLFNIYFRFREKYVILLDSDLLFLRRPDPVVEIIRSQSNRTFHGGGGNALSAAFHELGFAFPKVDVDSFNAGFFGLKNDLPDALLTDIVDRICQRNPGLLSHWEIEQAIWAVLLNHCPGQPLNLSRLSKGYIGNGWRTYRDLSERAAMVHFVGATRFRNLMYPRLASRVIRQLQARLPAENAVATPSSEQPELLGSHAGRDDLGAPAAGGTN